MDSIPSVEAIAKMIDHSLLHPAMTDDEIRAGCALARKQEVAAACVKPYAIPLAKAALANSTVAVCAVISFPHGNSMTRHKVLEAEGAVQAGAVEIDMVINIGKALSGDWNYVEDEIAAVNRVVIRSQALLKVIFENDYLREAEIIALCQICSRVGVAFVKTSTGYGFVKQANGYYAYEGATVGHIQLMRQHCVPSVQLKAAGGIRSLDQLLAMRSLGVSRIGASATAAILEEARER